MTSNSLLWTGITGAVLAVLCCATPLLVILLGAVGLSAMILPVLVLGIAPVSIPIAGWLAIAVAILLGSSVVWWTTERAWGKFSSS